MKVLSLRKETGIPLGIKEYFDMGHSFEALAVTRLFS